MEKLCETTFAEPTSSSKSPLTMENFEKKESSTKVEKNSFSYLRFDKMRQKIKLFLSGVKI